MFALENTGLTYHKMKNLITLLKNAGIIHMEKGYMVFSVERVPDRFKELLSNEKYKKAIKEGDGETSYRLYRDFIRKNHIKPKYTILDSKMSEIYFKNPEEWGFLDNISAQEVISLHVEKNLLKNKTDYKLYKEQFKKEGGYHKHIKKDYESKKLVKNKKESLTPLLSELENTDKYIIEEINNHNKNFGININVFRAFGENDYLYGRFYSDFTSLPKKLRKIVTDKLNLEEIDAHQFNLSMIYLLKTGELPKYDFYSDWVYKIFNIPIDHKDHNAYRTMFKGLALMLFGSKDKKTGRMALRYYLHNKVGLLLPKNKENSLHISSKKRIFKSFLKNNNFPLDTQYTPVEEEKIINVIKKSELGNFLFMDINPFCQNMESKVLEKMIRRLQHQNTPILTVHDCFYTNKKNKEKNTILLNNYMFVELENLKTEYINLLEKKDKKELTIEENEKIKKINKLDIRIRKLLSKKVEYTQEDFLKGNGSNLKRNFNSISLKKVFSKKIKRLKNVFKKSNNNKNYLKEYKEQRFFVDIFEEVINNIERDVSNIKEVYMLKEILKTYILGVMIEGVNKDNNKDKEYYEEKKGIRKGERRVRIKNREGVYSSIREERGQVENDINGIFKDIVVIDNLPPPDDKLDLFSVG